MCFITVFETLNVSIYVLCWCFCKHNTVNNKLTVKICLCFGFKLVPIPWWASGVNSTSVSHQTPVFNITLMSKWCHMPAGLPLCLIVIMCYVFMSYLITTILLLSWFCTDLDFDLRLHRRNSEYYVPTFPLGRNLLVFTSCSWIFPDLHIWPTWNNVYTQLKEIQWTTVNCKVSYIARRYTKTIYKDTIQKHKIVA